MLSLWANFKPSHRGGGYPYNSHCHSLLDKWPHLPLTGIHRLHSWIKLLMPFPLLISVVSQYILTFWKTNSSDIVSNSVSAWFQYILQPRCGVSPTRMSYYLILLGNWEKMQTSVWGLLQIAKLTKCQRICQNICASILKQGYYQP